MIIKHVLYPFFHYTGEPQVVLTDVKGAPLPINVLDNKDGTFRVEFSSAQAGTVKADIKFANQPVPNSPFKITFQSGVKVYGPAVEKPVEPRQPTYLVVDCKDVGPGMNEIFELLS